MKIHAIMKLLLAMLAIAVVEGCDQRLVPDCDTCDIFTCLVNGIRFLPAGGWKTTNLSAFTYQDKRIDVGANGDDKQFIGFSLRLSDTLRVGDYLINDYNPGWGTYLSATAECKTDAAHQGRLTISKITFGDIPLVEGSFSFESVSASTGQRVSVSNGSFRIRFGRYK